MNTEITTATTETTEKDYSDLGLTYDIEVYQAYATNFVEGYKMENLEDWYTEVEDSYSGQFDSDEEFAEDLLDSTGDLDRDSLLARYFDIEKFARDLMYDYVELDGYYFRNC